MAYGHATVQGAAQIGLRAFGVPPGGAWDVSIQNSLNLALGNSPEDAVLELALCRITLCAREELVLVWDGAGVVASINGTLCPHEIVSLSSGDHLEIEPPKFGARVWVAINGGFIWGGGTPLKRGDILRRGLTSGHAAAFAPSVAASDASVIRAIPDRAEFGHLFDNAYRVRHDSNRVGIRLDGAKMKHQLELPSEPAVPGVIQITPEGLPIILGPDGPTIGGYPRAGVVATADMSKLAQLRPGDLLHFSPITVDIARTLIR